MQAGLPLPWQINSATGCRLCSYVSGYRRSQQLEQIVGPIGEQKPAAILASSAKLEDVVEAKALADGKRDIVG